MTDIIATPEQLAMARRIAANMPGVNALQRCAFFDGEWDDAPTVQAALAAIIETQRLDAEKAETLAHAGLDNPEDDLIWRSACLDTATAIREDKHYGKDHQ